MPPHVLIDTEGGDAIEPIGIGCAGGQDRFGCYPTGVPVDAESTSQRLDVSVVVLESIGDPDTGTNCQLRTRTDELTVYRSGFR